MESGKKVTRNILNFLMRNNLTLKELAKQAKIPYQTMVSIKTKNKYTTQQIDSIAKAIGCEANELFRDTSFNMVNKSEEIKMKFPDFIDNIIKS